MTDEQAVVLIKKYLRGFSRKKTVKNYYHQINLDESREERIVVIGDIHCDFTSLSTILTLLSTDESYNYLTKARFVFLGDYIDRGNNMLRTIRLLLGFKKNLEERCILLRGNHELIFCEDGRMNSYVTPSDTADELNNKFAGDKEFLELFANFFNQLPSYCVVHAQKKNYFLVHGSIPEDIFTYGGAYIDTETAEVKFLKEPPEPMDEFRRKMLLSMLWGDPKEVKRKMQFGFESRFEFGREQFDSFMKTNKLDVLIRSHEPVNDGVKSFFDGRLYTLFSTGGVNNPDTSYWAEGSLFNVSSPKIAIINSLSEEITFIDIFKTMNHDK